MADPVQGSADDAGGGVKVRLVEDMQILPPSSGGLSTPPVPSTWPEPPSLGSPPHPHGRAQHWKEEAINYDISIQSRPSPKPKHKLQPPHWEMQESTAAPVAPMTARMHGLTGGSSTSNFAAAVAAAAVQAVVQPTTEASPPSLARAPESFVVTRNATPLKSRWQAVPAAGEVSGMMTETFLESRPSRAPTAAERLQNSLRAPRASTPVRSVSMHATVIPDGAPRHRQPDAAPGSHRSPSWKGGYPGTPQTPSHGSAGLPRMPSFNTGGMAPYRNTPMFVIAPPQEAVPEQLPTWSYTSQRSSSVPHPPPAKVVSSTVQGYEVHPPLMWSSGETCWRGSSARFSSASPPDAAAPFARHTTASFHSATTSTSPGNVVPQVASVRNGVGRAVASRSTTPSGAVTQTPHQSWHGTQTTRSRPVTQVSEATAPGVTRHVSVPVRQPPAQTWQPGPGSAVLRPGSLRHVQVSPEGQQASVVPDRSHISALPAHHHPSYPSTAPLPASSGYTSPAPPSALAADGHFAIVNGQLVRVVQRSVSRPRAATPSRMQTSNPVTTAPTDVNTHANRVISAVEKVTAATHHTAASTASKVQRLVSAPATCQVQRLSSVPTASTLGVDQVHRLASAPDVSSLGIDQVQRSASVPRSQSVGVDQVQRLASARGSDNVGVDQVQTLASARSPARFGADQEGVSPRKEGASPRRVQSQASMPSAPSLLTQAAVAPERTGITHRSPMITHRSPMELETFEVENLNFETDNFDPTVDPLKAQVLAKLESLGIEASCEIEVLQNAGGFNEGMWLLHGASRQGMLVLKLVKRERRHPMLPTDVENFMSIIEGRPTIINDHALAFPIKILHCVGPGEDWSRDLIVMRKAPGQGLDTTIAAKCAFGQQEAMMQDLHKLGSLMAQIHSVYGMQHGDLQPSNIFHDEANDWFSLVDCGGMGPNPYVNDDDLQHLCAGIALVTPNMDEEFQAEVKQNLEAGYFEEMEVRRRRRDCDVANL